MKVGVLALQGDFREHINASQQCGNSAIEVRRESELAQVDALILPGGESTTIVHLAQNFDLYQPRSARRCGTGISATLIPTIASPSPRDASAKTLAS